ncbi:MAG: hypothetical protein JSV26_11395 [bacterium]|nr:MAG: hypothetical protein JSV26_11395 [bacterium]
MDTQVKTANGWDRDGLPSLTDALEPKWYVVRTKPREELRCREDLVHRGIPVFCPLTREFRWRRRRHETVPYFPGYLFARFTFPDQYYSVKWAKGVSHLVQFGNNDPPAVEDSVIEFFMNRVDEDGFLDQTPEFRPGDRVRFREGPMKDLIGTILRTDTAQSRVLVLMELLYQAKVEVETHLVTTI